MKGVSIYFHPENKPCGQFSLKDSNYFFYPDLSKNCTVCVADYSNENLDEPIAIHIEDDDQFFTITLSIEEAELVSERLQKAAEHAKIEQEEYNKNQS